MVIHNKGGEDPQKATDGAEEGEGQAFGLDGAVFAVIEEDQGTGQHEEGGRRDGADSDEVQGGCGAGELGPAFFWRARRITSD